MTATIIGATGLIGGYLLEELLQDNYYDIVRILIRRTLELTHPKLEKKLVDFNDAESFRLALEGSDVVFCAIGTTQKKVKGDKEAYRKVDYDITVNAAKFCKLNGCETFVFVSAVGANSKSNNFYLKLKGEVEEAVKAVGLKSVHTMRPSVLFGDRKEFRLGEKMSKVIMSVFSFLIPSKYKAIHGRDVAKSMISLTTKGKEGFHIYEYKAIKRKN
jgi:uncharacterized protein YbjT (DUF2867 family)